MNHAQWSLHSGLHGATAVPRHANETAQLHLKGKGGWASYLGDVAASARAARATT